MNSLDDLARRLEAAGRDGWEDAYACTPVELSREQVYELVTSGRPWSDWLAFRFDAGPPGVPLPAHEQALTAVLGGRDGTPRDAYRVVFAPHPVSDEASPELILAVLVNSAACALKGGTTWFATWLAARAGVAALAFGQPDYAWHILDTLTTGRGHPQLEVLAIFEVLRGNPALERDPHVRAAIGWFWPRFRLPVVPQLPLLLLLPASAPDGGALAGTLDELKRIGADHVHDLVMAYMDAADRAVLDEHAEHPLVRALQARALVPGADAPDCGDLPPWFEAWARAVFRTGQWYLARLAGLVLHRAGHADGSFVAVLIMRTARAADLPLLAAGFDQPEMQSMLDELVAAACTLPAEAADALVAEAWPRHVDAGRALDVLARHVDALERLDARARGVVEHITRMMRSMVVDRTRDLAEAGPADEQLHTAARRAAARLSNAGLLGAPDIERAAATIAVPDLTLGLVERTAETSAALDPLEQLLLALALRRALTGTEREAHWRPVFAQIASDAVFELSAPELLGLRLELLDELLAAPNPLQSRGELYFQRANTRHARSRNDSDEFALALADLRAAVRWSRVEGDASRFAVATAAWVRLVAWQDACGDAAPSAFDEGSELLHEALALDLDPHDQALLHQAHAHLIRRRYPKDAVLAHERALAIAPREESYATVLAAELVGALVRAGRVGEAVERGLAFLDAASCRTRATELGTLHLSVGEALQAAGRFSEARQQFEAGLPLIRGRELHNEDLVHIHLARVGLIMADVALAEEHLRLLRDRADTLDDSARQDFHALEAAAVRDAGRIEGVDPGGGHEDDTPVAPELHGGDVLRFLDHPAGEAFMRIRTERMPSAACDVDVPGFAARFELTVPVATEPPAARDPVRLDKLEALEGSMRSQATDRTRPGVLAAAVALVAHLARAGRRSIEDVRAATAAACDALLTVADLGVRSILLREIALVWSRDRHPEEAVRDLALAIDLLRQCIELEGGEDRAAGDTVALLARALRDLAGGRRDHLREARRLHELRFRRARRAGDPDAIAATLCDLAEVEIEQAPGDRRERQRQGERRLREAATAARAPRLQARVAANLASVQTRIASLLDGAERLRSLDAAHAAFGEVAFALLDEHERRAAELHRTLCEASLARLRGDRDGELERWRHHLDSLGATTPAHVVAAAKHQLALALMSGEGATAEQLAEGLRLASEAAVVRTIERDPKGCSETAVEVGRALVAALRTNSSFLLGALADRAAAEARSWLEQAIAAARTLGPGEALADAALEVCELELVTATDATVVDQLEQAWAIVAQATPYLVLHVESREREARTAMRIAAELSHRLAVHATPTAVVGVAHVLDGEAAEVVARWLRRAQEPARRPLRARLARPPAVSARLWEEWVSALADRDGHRITDALDRVRAAEPRFPDDPAADEPTWRWLLAHPDSAAISLVLTEPKALAVIMQIDPSALRRTWVLGLDLPPPPLACDALANLVSGKVPGQEADRAIESLAGWLRQHVVAPLERFLGRAPAAVLWCPDPRLRQIAPGAIWPGLPVATTASLALPNLGASPSRRRSTLIVLADPGDQAPEPGLDLHGHGLPALESLARVAAELGTVRLLGSVGRSSGRTLLGNRTEVRNTPASAENLLAEAGEHDVIVVLAHGRVDAIEDAALLCLDEDGELERLDVTTLARRPDRFAGATVLLLSCETGRTSDSLAEPGGVAGTLVSAGARHVIAPLWPVQLDVAVQVGEAVLRGTQRGAAPWEVLAALRVDSANDAPTLGGPPPPRATRRTERRLQGLAFVTWVG
ncbi:MAG TPA: hypothetical protein VNO30_36815 [Kofleriaceae bacterium]|nr:hypothetical protein [Kofleriaceae bacterium]